MYSDKYGYLQVFHLQWGITMAKIVLNDRDSAPWGIIGMALTLAVTQTLFTLPPLKRLRSLAVFVADTETVATLPPLVRQTSLVVFVTDVVETMATLPPLVGQTS